MRHSKTTVKPGKAYKTLEQPWLFYEPFDTKLAETLMEYHWEGFKKDYPKWKNRLNQQARTRCRKHLLALEKLTHWMRQELTAQHKSIDNIGEFKKSLEDPEYGEETTTTNISRI